MLFPALAARVTRSAPSRRLRHVAGVARMQEIAEQPTMTSGAAAELAEAAARAEEWAKEPFLRPDEDPAIALAPETARRRALDAALAEIESGQATPSNEWRVRYALMLGLE